MLLLVTIIYISSIDKYQVLGRNVHMDFVQEHLRTKRKVTFADTQERPNGIELEILADTVYVKVHDRRALHDVMIEIRFVYVHHEVGKEEHGTRE